MTGATSCVFASKPIISGLPATTPCTSGSVTEEVTIPADASAKALKYTLDLSVVGSKTVKAKPIKFTVDAKPALPTVKSVSPASGSLAGLIPVTVKGKNLNGATAVTFGTAPGTHVTPVSATEVTVLSPASSTTGPVNVSVTTPGGTSAISKEDKFTYLPVPVVTGISPGWGPKAGGTTVTITGTDLSGATSVKFGTKAGAISADSATSVSVTSPAESVGTVNVTVTTGDGTSAISPADDFAYTSVVNPCTQSITADSEITAGIYDACPFDVPAGVTVAINPGAIFKLGSSQSTTVEGTLDAVGTSADPITFTSINDNSVGGDTGSGSPLAGDWVGIDVDGSGTVDLEHATVNYAITGVVVSSSASVTISSNTFANEQHAAANVSGTSALTFTDNQAIDGGYAAAFNLDSSSLNFDDIFGNVASGGLDPAVTVDGTVGTTSTMAAEAVPWQIDTQLNIPSGVTLTIDAGTVVKSTGDYICPGTGGSLDGSLCVFGTLNAVGTSADPITFTSINDNSVGGDTGSGSPLAGDWVGIDVDGSGTVDLEHATVNYAITGVVVSSSASVTISSNTFANEQHAAANVSGTSALTFTDNQAIDGGYAAAFNLDSSSLNFDDIFGNVASGGLDPAVTVDGTVGTTSTMAAEAVPWQIDTQLNIPSGVTLTIDAGTVVKSTGDYICPGTGGSLDGSLCVFGTLNAVGTSADPITFTSINDNSVGGDTGSGSPLAGDWVGIDVDGSGTVDLEHATVNYAITGVVVSSSASVTISSNTFANEQHAAANVSGTSALTFTDNQAIDGGYAAAFNLDSSSLNFDDIFGNVASGGLDPAVTVDGTVGTTSTMAAEAVPWQIDTQLNIPSGVTLTIDAGTVVKSTGDYICPGTGGSLDGSLCVFGTLNAVGTSADPITFTSINDNSVGGDTGSGSPLAGDWVGIDVDGSGTVDLQDDVLDYASAALTASGSGSLTATNISISNVSTGINFSASVAVVSGSIDDASLAVSSSNGSLSFRGSLIGDQMGVESCDWGTANCGVDAAYTYWGSSLGPAGLACGQVTVNPWYAASGGGSTEGQGADIFGTGNCDASQTPDEQLATAASNFSTTIGDEQIQCDQPGFEDICQLIQQQEACLSSAEQALGGQSPFTIPNEVGEVPSAASSYLESSEEEDVSDLSSVLGAVGGIIDVVGVIQSLITAYNGCA